MAMPTRLGRPKKLGKISTTTKVNSNTDKVKPQGIKNACGSEYPKKACKKKNRGPKYSETQKLLDEILTDIKKDKEESERMKLLNMQIDCLKTPEKPKFQPSKLFPNEIITGKEQHFGLKIIDHHKHQLFFSSAEDLKKVTIKNITSSFEKRLISSPEALIPFLQTATTHNKGPFSDDLMFFVFGLLCVEEGEIAQSYKRFLLHAFEVNLSHKSIIWIPSFEDIVAVLVNIGCTVREQGPLSGFFNDAKRQLTALYLKRRKISGFNKPQSEHLKIMKLKNLGVCFDLLAELSGLGVYKDEQLSLLCLLLCWLSLDPQTTQIEINIRNCIFVCLNAISNVGWRTKCALELTVHLKHLIGRADHLQKVCELLPSVGRSQNLRKCISFLALHICLNVPYTFKFSVTPKDLFNLLLSKPLLSLVPQYDLLILAATHIDYAVGNKICSEDVASLHQLCDIFSLTSSRITDSMLNKSTLAKNGLIMVSCKWKIILQQMSPVSKGSLKNFGKDKLCDVLSPVQNQQILESPLPDIKYLSPSAAKRKQMVFNRIVSNESVRNEKTENYSYQECSSTPLSKNIVKSARMQIDRGSDHQEIKKVKRQLNFKKRKAARSS